MSLKKLIRLQDKRLRNDLLRGIQSTKNVSPVMVLLFRKNDGMEARYAVYNPRRLSGAVRRNRVKRIFREILNRVKSRLAGYDFVIIPRREVPCMEDIFPAVEKILVETGILRIR